MRHAFERLGLALASLALFALLLELGVRGVFAFRSDPWMLLYGTPFDRVERASARWHTVEGEARWDRTVRVDERPIKVYLESPHGRYSKYQPRSARGMKLADGETYRIEHNNFGFRGPDFSREKPEGVVRVIALGASSTFGYLDRDDETYPYLLERLLEARRAARSCGGARRFEVLNLGIPHLDSSNVYALFMAEGLDLSPDVVTFYGGGNDTRRIERAPAERRLLELASVSVTARYLAHLLQSSFETFSAGDLALHLEGKRERFLANVSRMADECERRGILFVPVVQQARSYVVETERLDAVGYDEEVELVKARLAQGHRLDLTQLQFLMHAELTRGLREWAAARGAPLVDFVHELEAARRRDALLSWVHLAPAGNRVLAAALARPIFEGVCGGDRSAARP